MLQVAFVRKDAEQRGASYAVGVFQVERSKDEGTFIARAVVYEMSRVTGEVEEIAIILGEASSEVDYEEALQRLAEAVGMTRS